MKYQLLPALSEMDRLRLRADIKARGVRYPIEVDENGDILDGHHRKSIADELGIECPSVVVSLNSEMAKRAHVLRVNFNRRHLTKVQQDSIRRHQKEIALEMNATCTQERIAMDLGVMQQTVSNWLATLRTRSDNTSIGKADHRKLPPETDAAVLDALADGKTQRQVANEVGVALSTVSRIKNGRPPDRRPKGPQLQTKTYPGRRVIEGVRKTVDTFVGLASGLDGVSVADANPDPDETFLWEEQLAQVVSSVNRFRRQIKEYRNGQ